MDDRRVDAVRILDFCHAAGHLAVAAQAAYGPGTAACCAWVERQRHELRYGEPEAVLAALQAVYEAARGEARAVVGGSLEYLQKRREQIGYAEFELMGLPIGSGIVESANKLLVEERLKGAGMHWARHNINPMLALRTVAFNDRWAEAWPQIVAQLGAKRAAATRARRLARLPATEARAEPEAPGEDLPAGKEVMAPTRGGSVADPPEHPAPTPALKGPTTGPSTQRPIILGAASASDPLADRSLPPTPPERSGGHPNQTSGLRQKDTGDIVQYCAAVMGRGAIG